jgi:hypothetical protein
VAWLLDRIYQLLREIGSSEINKSKEKSAFSLSTLANELNAELEWLMGILLHLENMIQDSTLYIPKWFVNQVANPVCAALNKIKAYLTPLLKVFYQKYGKSFKHAYSKGVEASTEGWHRHPWVGKCRNRDNIWSMRSWYAEIRHLAIGSSWTWESAGAFSQASQQKR